MSRVSPTCHPLPRPSPFLCVVFFLATASSAFIPHHHPILPFFPYIFTWGVLAALAPALVTFFLWQLLRGHVGQAVMQIIGAYSQLAAWRVLPRAPPPRTLAWGDKSLFLFSVRIFLKRIVYFFRRDFIHDYSQGLENTDVSSILMKFSPPKSDCIRKSIYLTNVSH